MAGASGHGCAAPGGPAADDAPVGFRSLEPGLELGVFAARLEPGPDPGHIRILRIDTERFDLRLLNTSAPGQGRLLSARGWSEEKALTLAYDVLRGNVERVFFAD